MFNWIAKWINRKSYYAPSGGGYADVWNKQPKPDRYSLVREYKGVAYACANINAQAIVKTDLDLYRKASKGKKSLWSSRNLSYQEFARIKSNPYQKVAVADSEELLEITNHPLLNVLNNPNPYLDYAGLMEFTQLFQEVTGAAYWYVAKNVLGVPVQIWLLCPQWVKTLTDDKGLVAGYEYGTMGSKVTYEPDEVIPFLLPNLDNPLVDGMSPLLSVFESINIENKYSATEAAILDNEGRPAGILTAKDGLGAEEAERWERKFNAKFRRAGNGGVIVLDEDANFNPLTFSPRDLSRLQIHENAKESICSAYGVPPAMLGSGASQYKVDVDVRQHHVEYAIVPRLRRIQSVLNRYLVPMFDDSLFLMFEDASPQNIEQYRKDLELVSRNGAITNNELRQKLRFDPTSQDWGEERTGQYFSGNADANASGIDPTQAEGNTPQDIETLPSMTLNGAQIAAAMSIVQSVAEGTIARDSGIGALEVLLNLTTEQAERIMGTVGKKAACGCIKKKGKNPYKLPTGERLAKTLADHYRQQKKEVIDKLRKRNQLPSRFVPPDEWDDDLYKKTFPILREIAIKNFNATAREINRKRKGIVWKVDVGTDVISPELEAAVRALVLQFCDETNATTTQIINDALAALRAELEAGLLAGDSIDALADRVNDVFEDLASDNAWTIATTESSRAHHEAMKAAAIASGVCTGFELLPSSACCDLCQEIADDGPIELDEYFYNDPTAPAAYQDRLVPIHPNCECTMTYVLSEEETEAEAA